MRDSTTDSEEHHNIKKMKVEAPRMLPFAESIEQFLENPETYAPKPEYLSISYGDDETVLTHAIKNSNLAAVQSLLAAGADANLINKKGVTPMSGAAHKGNIVIMQLLLDYGANVNLLNTSGSTALIQASHFGWDEAVRFLLRNHAFSDLANVKGTTALMRSAQEGHIVISELLIAANADVNKKNNEGMNALMLASQRGHANMVMLLIQSHAHMDEQTSQGSTALMLACKRGHEQVVETLVSMGAEIFIQDSRGRTAVDTAIKRQHHSLLAWLNTKVQKERMSESCRRLRTKLLLDMRRAYVRNKLTLSIENQRALTLMKLFKQREHSSSDDKFASLDFEAPVAMHAIGALVSSPAPVLPASMARRRAGYAEWQWPLILQRCMDLPDGVFETIVEYMPTPRIWHWSLLRLKQRCRIAPRQAIFDVSMMLDEMMADMLIFPGPDQEMLLIRLARCPDVCLFFCLVLYLVDFKVLCYILGAAVHGERPEVPFISGRAARSVVGPPVACLAVHRYGNYPQALSRLLVHECRSRLLQVSFLNINLH